MHKRSEQLDHVQRHFIENHCEMPCHFCATGEPIPEDGRAYRSIPGIALRKRQPCKHYDVHRGCTHPKHPKHEGR